MKQETIQQIKVNLQSILSAEDVYLELLKSDERQGVQKLLKQKIKYFEAQASEKERMHEMFRYERALYQENYNLICGIDEVGRGPLAGPVVACAVILPINSSIQGLNDSKKIPKKQHQAIFERIQKEAIAIGIGIVEPDVIDNINIYEATKVAMQDAIENLEVSPDYLLIDAMQLSINIPQKSIIKGDANSASIAAASIVAKVTRDKIMADYALKFPAYDFEKNAGYGTKSHLLALEKNGVLPIHRKSFEPVKTMLNCEH